IQFSDNRREYTQLSTGSQAASDEDVGGNKPQRRVRTGPNKRVASEQRVKPSPMVPDEYTYRIRADGQTLALVSDYKAAHKVAAAHVKQAVAKETLFMEVVEQINSNKSKTGAEQDRFLVEQHIAMAMAQVYHYMFYHGVKYGRVAAGECSLFLYVDPTDPQTLYCHASVPGEDVGDFSAADWVEQISHTAVAQMTSFLLLSLESDALQGASLEASLEKANAVLTRWPEPYEEAAHLSSTENTESSFAQSSPRSEGQEDFTSNAAPAIRKVPLRSRSCKPSEPLGNIDESDEEPDAELPPLGVKPVSSKRKVGPSYGSSDADVKTSSSPSRQYCTQACLLGLKRGLDLDGKCPNIDAHRSAARGRARHPLTLDGFRDLVEERLCQNPYEDCSALDMWGMRGAVGVLFKLELKPYGYTFVAKGTASNRLAYVENEGRIYTRLEALQGQRVPVHLGLARLKHGYILPDGTRAVHMMLMSWAGERAAGAGLDEAKFKEERKHPFEC
ncbi:hypothetical protein S40288_10402, partial [Stachybotrys chartarum IBT 40288]